MCHHRLLRIEISDVDNNRIKNECGFVPCNRSGWVTRYYRNPIPAAVRVGLVIRVGRADYICFGLDFDSCGSGSGNRFSQNKVRNIVSDKNTMHLKVNEYIMHKRKNGQWKREYM